MGANGASGISGCLPLSSCATRRPVRGAATSPTWPWPKACTISAVAAAGRCRAARPACSGDGPSRNSPVTPAGRAAGRESCAAGGREEFRRVSSSARPRCRRSPPGRRSAGRDRSRSSTSCRRRASAACAARSRDPRSWRDSRARIPAAGGRRRLRRAPSNARRRRSPRGRRRSRRVSVSTARSCPASIRKPVARAATSFAPCASAQRDQRRDIGAGIAAMPALLDQRGEAVARMRAPARAGATRRPTAPATRCRPGGGCARPIASAANSARDGIDVHQRRAARSGRPTPASSASAACSSRRVLQQGAQRDGGAGDPRLGPAGEQVAAPARAAPSAGRTSGSPAARAGRRGSPAPSSTGPGVAGGITECEAEPAGIAVARRLFAAGRAGLDDGDAMALAQRLDGADHADRAGSDDGDVAAFRHRLRLHRRREILADRDRARIDDAVEDRRLARGERALEGRRELFGALDALAMAAEGACA